MKKSIAEAPRSSAHEHNREKASDRIASGIQEWVRETPDLSADQASALKSLALIACCIGAVAISGIVVSSGYAFKLSKAEGFVLSPATPL